MCADVRVTVIEQADRPVWLSTSAPGADSLVCCADDPVADCGVGQPGHCGDQGVGSLVHPRLRLHLHLRLRLVCPRPPALQACIMVLHHRYLVFVCIYASAYAWSAPDLKLCRLALCSCSTLLVLHTGSIPGLPCRLAQCSELHSGRQLLRSSASCARLHGRPGLLP